MPSSFPSRFSPDKGDKIYRRSVYTFWKRGLPPPQMTIFDAPTRESCIARRERTNTPLQSLLMMNEPQYFSATMLFCKSLLARPEWDDDQQMATAFEMITTREPSRRQMDQFRAARKEFRLLYGADPKAANDMIQACTISQVREISEPDLQAELAALTMVVHAMFNMDAVKTRG